MEDTQGGEGNEGQSSRNGVNDHKGFESKSFPDSATDGMGDLLGGGGDGGGGGRFEPEGEKEEAGQGLESELQCPGKGKQEEEEIISSSNARIKPQAMVVEPRD